MGLRYVNAVLLSYEWFYLLAFEDQDEFHCDQPKAHVRDHDPTEDAVCFGREDVKVRGT